MKPITIDIKGALPVPHPSFELVRNKVQELAEMARGEWIRQAQMNLRAASAEYIGGIQPIQYRGASAFIHLTGWLPNAIENGLNPFDMKPGLLGGPRAKKGKNGGRYNTVPFRHGVPGTTGRNVGTPMPITGLSPKGKGVSAVHIAAKKLSASSDSAAGRTAWGGKTGGFGGLGMRTQLPVAGGRPGAYTWKHSPYEGIYKVAKTYKKATQNQYVSFRRVSDNSDPNAWWHPGITARRFAPRVSAYIKREIHKAF